MGRIPGKFERLAAERHARDLALTLLPGGHPRGLWFDQAAGDRVVTFIEGFCKHHIAEWAGKPLLLEAWQKAIIRQAFGWKRADQTRRFRTLYLEVPRKNGKALALTTPIPTPGGWSTMGDLRVGDQVFGETGEICTVTGATDVQIGRLCYRVRFSDGCEIVADAEHEWFTETRRTGLPRTGLGPKSNWIDRHIRTTVEIAGTLRCSNAKTEWNHRVPVAGPLKPPRDSLPIDPYVFGAWLGDGNSDGTAMTQGAQDFDLMRGYFVAAGYRVSDRSTPGTFGLLGFSVLVKGMGVRNNKHVPAAYLRASEDQRLDLMRGLMDTDGYCSKAGQCEFTTVSRALRDGFIELARSLGFKPSLKTARATIYGRDVGEKYRIQFWATADRSVFRLPRKTARLRPTQADPRSTKRQIVSVDPVSSVPVRCIEVDSPSHLYLAGDGMIPTHNSEVAAALALYLLVADDEPGAQIYSSGTKTEQARIVWECAAAMVQASPDLKRFVKTFRSSMTCAQMSSVFKPLGSDSKTLDGLNPHGNVVDELHAHPDRKVWDVLDTAMGARRQPMTIAITTAGSYEPEAIGWQMHEYASKVLEGVIDDDSIFAVIYAADPPPDDGDLGYYFTEAAQRQANPNYGISAKPEFLQKQCEKAQNQPGFLNEYLRLHLNVWTRTVSKWLALDAWAACETDPAMTTRATAFGRELGLEGRRCYGGLDLSSKLDLTAFALVFPAPDGWIDVLCRFWLPEATVATYAKKGLRHYETWVRDGWLQTTPGSVIDYAFIEAEIESLARCFKVEEIAFDNWNATDLAIRLGNKSIKMIDCGQGFKSLSEPSKDLEARVVEKKIRHANNPILRFCVSNAVVRRDPAGNIKPDKEAAVDRIDGVVALIIALSRIIRAPGDGLEAYGDGGGFKQL